MELIIRRKVLITMLFMGLTLLGIFSYRQLPVELLPNTQIPYLFVQIGTPLDVDPRYMERQAVIPVEGAIGTLKNVEKIESSIDRQQAFIQISYKQNTDIKLAYLKLLEKIEQVRQNLPDDFYVQALRFDMQMLNNQLMTIQVRGSGGVDRVREVVNNDVLNRIKNVNGVANVEVFGGRERSLEIILDEDAGQAFGISPSDIQALLNENSVARTFAGKVTDKNRMVFINVVSDYSDIRDIGNLIVNENGPVRLHDVADIRFGYKNQTSLSRVNGQETVTMQLTRDTQSNMIDLSHRVQDEVAKLNDELVSKDITIVIENNQADRMENNIDMIIRLAIFGGVLAILILWIFLNNLTLVISIGLAIPVSVYTAFNLFYLFGITINSLTLLGMALAIGMLLDNSIVVMENIYRLAAANVPPDKAALQGTAEVWRSIAAATLTTIMVFLPFAFSSNFFVATIGKNIGISIISTLLVSLVVAMLLIPMITHTFLLFRNIKHRLDFSAISFHNRLIQIYRVILKTCMRKPAQTALGALGIFFASLLIIVGLSFVQSQEPEEVELTLYVSMPGGSTLENTDLMIADVEQRLEDLKEKKDVISQIYDEEAQITIVLRKDYQKVRHYSIPQIKQEIYKSLSGLSPANFSWDPPPSGRYFGGYGGGEEMDILGFFGIGAQTEKVYIKGENYDEILAQANLVKYYLSRQQDIENVNINIPSARPEILLNFNKQIMSLYDIPANAVLNELNTFPREFASGSEFKQGTSAYDIVIRTSSPIKDEERNLDDLKKLDVRGSNNARFELQQISSFNLQEGTPTIRRVNQNMQLEVEYAFINQVLNDKDLLTASRIEVDNLVRSMSVPEGISIEVEHEQENLLDFRFLILASLILIYMILASVFESFSKPVVLMFAIPMAAIGSFIALILTGNSLMNPNSLTGMIIIIGIVVNNGIILLDYSNILRHRGYGPSRALMMSGLARVRPILITSLTTIIALLPLAMGKGEYIVQIGAPFAITIIGGLAFSSLLTLVFIPTLISGIQSAFDWIRSQNWMVKLILTVLYIAGVALIVMFIDRLVWKIIDLILIIVLAPAAIYFVQNSLRVANEKLIADSEKLQITIRNLVKIYDRDNRFAREWKSGLKIRERMGLARTFNKLKDFNYLIWQLPLLTFLIYFIYFYLQKGFWYFVLPVGLYLLILSMLRPLKLYAGYRSQLTGRKRLKKLSTFLYETVRWGMPVIVLSLFYSRYKLIGLDIVTIIIWYLLIAIKLTADRLSREQININRLKGKFTGLRKMFFRFVTIMPFIGVKKQPFKALKGVSLQIENGMFGLLGPNGAGKSTLMRIICGILEPSYGQITINGFNISEKREELQGLIGYLPQEFGVYENLTAWEFLNYIAILKKIKDPDKRKERIEYVLGAVHMSSHKDEKLGSYSGGMKQRIGIAQILLHLPRILVVDEPTAGLDPRERIRFRNLLVELSRDRIVVFSTHIIEDVASSCNNLAVIRNGEVVYLGAPVEMAKTAQGQVWMADMDIAEFETFKKQHMIIHHMRDGQKIRVRYISDKPPVEGSKSVKANLEDAYLCLLLEKKE